MREDKNTIQLVPRLRFPEFLNAGEWSAPKLADISTPVEERVGDRDLTPVSISAGIGFVPQVEKFGRDISGNQYRLYTVVRDGDFVYNKGNSLKFPEGCVYDLQGWGEVAAPNVFICFRLKDGYESRFYRQCFEQNMHGAQLRKHITSGARSNGLLNIGKEAFFGIRLPTPNHDEQQKIADCVASLDELIAAEVQKFAALKAHKNGLMQRLFPGEDETVPRLRFAEFQAIGEWEKVPMGILLARPPEYGLNAPAVSYSNDLPTYLRITDIDEDGRFLSDSKVSVDFPVKDDDYLEEGDIVIARTGASVGKSYIHKKENGRLVFAGFLIRIRPDQKFIYPGFLSSFLATQQYWRWVEVNSTRSGQPGVNGTELASLRVPMPLNKRGEYCMEEQKRIADCLSAADNLIVGQSMKIERLKAHKLGLMQRLFPSDEVHA